MTACLLVVREVRLPRSDSLAQNIKANLLWIAHQSVFFLEMTKPLSLLGSHFLVFFGPIINSFIQAENYYRTVQVFEEPKNVEILLEMIEELDRDE